MTIKYNRTGADHKPLIAVGRRAEKSGGGRLGGPPVRSLDEKVL